MRRRGFQRRSLGAQFTGAVARQCGGWGRGKIVSLPEKESDKTQVHCQVGTRYVEEKSQNEKKKKKNCFCGEGNLLMGVVNSTRQKQWELQVALLQSGGILADVYKSCHMPKTSRQIEEKSR